MQRYFKLSTLYKFYRKIRNVCLRHDLKWGSAPNPEEGRKGGIFGDNPFCLFSEPLNPI